MTDDCGAPRCSPGSESASLKQLQDLQRRAGIPHLPTQLTFEARNAVSREGSRAYDWEDKPHRIVYDLCREIERLHAVAQEAPDPALMQVARMAKAAAEMELGLASAPNFSPREMLNAANEAISSLSSTDRCAACGCETCGEVALVDGKEWCHSCADAIAVPSTEGQSRG